MSAHLKAQLGRIVRLPVFVILAALLAVPAVQSALLRYPLLAALVGLFEVAYWSLVPTGSAPTVTAVLADPPTTTDPAPPTAKG